MNKETVINSNKNFCLIREELIDPLFDYLMATFPFAVWQKGGRSLSIGCGTGKEVFRLERNGFQSVACDISPSSLQKGLDSGFLSPSRVVLGDYRSCLGGQYDLIVALHIPPGFQLAKVVGDCLPSLAEGGVMIISGGDEKRREFEEFFKGAELSGVRKLTMVSEANLIDRRVLLIEKSR